MAIVFPHDPRAESSTIANPPSDALKAEHKAAVAAHQEQLDLYTPSRIEYEALYFPYQKVQTRFVKLTEKINSHHKTYRLHKQYVGLLANALLASNATLRSASKPFSDLQALKHATLVNDFRLASYTLASMIYRSKRLEKVRDIAWKRVQDLYSKCHEMFTKLEKNWMEIDRLHANVVELNKKMGSESGCDVAEGECESCLRNKNREIKEAEMIEQAAKEQKGVSGRASAQNVKKGAGLKGTLEVIAEEGELEETAGK